MYYIAWKGLSGMELFDQPVELPPTIADDDILFGGKLSNESTAASSQNVSNTPSTAISPFKFSHG